MYQPHPSQPYPSSNPGFTSPPPGTNPYRASPIPMNSRSPYTSALSPPPQSGYPGMPLPMPVPPNQGVGQRYHQYASRSDSARYTPSPSSAYPNPNPSQNSNSKQGYPPLPIPPQQTPQQKYKGTLAPGTIIKVGEAQVRIEKYLSEGGYAHVYLTTSDRPVYPPSSGSGNKGEGGNGTGTGSRGRWGEKGYSQHCLKRIAFEDEKVWADVRREIEVMKALPSNPHLTQYLASAHSRLPSGGYEVFILMEFCSGGGIIDLLNKRLRDRLKEIEILNIFTDVCEAVAAMHHLKQPLLHRDLKIENVLSNPTGQSPSPQRPTPLIFKLCDFGSTTFPSSHPPQNKLEAESLALDLNKHTTLQYRSPEMVEPMLGWAVGLPSDVWALGVLLYKLCYYTTPFEEHGTLAIVNAKYTFPQYPVYSPKIQHLIASMLVDHPARRPSVFEVLRTAHEMSGTRPEIDYPMPSRSFPISPNQQSSKPKSSSANLLDFTSPPPSSSGPTAQPDIASTVQPQRRGRPAREQIPKAASPAPAGLSPMPQPPVVPVPAEAAQPVPPKIQVTGEQKRDDAQVAASRIKGEKQPSTDAFGIPAKTSTTNQPSQSSDSFGDAFGAPSSRGVAGISQRFEGAAPARSGTANSGFSDSFTAKPSSATNSRPVQRVSSPETMVSSSASRQTSTSTETDGDISFETRFPSVDTLNSNDDAFSPIASPPKTVMSPPHLISPITSPPPSKPLLPAKASMMGHLTGEMANKHLSASTRVEGGPQPRSTQVTGTAFKGESVASPAGASTSGREGYFSSEDKEVVERPKPSATTASPVDLMTGDAFSSMTGSRQNSQIPSIALQDATTPSAPEGSRPVQTKRRSRPDLPTLDTIGTARRQSSAANSASRMKPSPQKMRTRHDGDDSSDEDLGPESATGMHNRPVSPVKRQGGIPSSSSFSDRKAAFESSISPGQSRNKSPSKQSSAPSTLPKPPIGNLRQLSSERVRPQSMFIPNSASRPLISPISDTPQSASGGFSRPSHARKGSITDILTKYEALQSPSAATAERKGSGDGILPAASPSIDAAKPVANNGVSRKPSVASKPQSLRKPTADVMPASAQARSISPEKRQSAFPPKTDSTPISDRPKPVLAEKPILAHRPSRHGDMPTVAGWSKSSSGRSFPISKPAPAATTPPPKAVTPLKEVQQEGTPTKGARSGSGSPEKQQSVGSLIARWNQTR